MRPVWSQPTLKDAEKKQATRRMRLPLYHDEKDNGGSLEGCNGLQVLTITHQDLPIDCILTPSETAGAIFFTRGYASNPTRYSTKRTKNKFFEFC